MPMTSFLPSTRLPTKPPPRWFWITSLSLLLLGIVFFALSLVVADQQSRLFLAVIPLILVCTLALHAYYLLHTGRERHVNEASLQHSQELLQEVTDHVQEVVWMLRADTNELILVNNAYESVTGHSLQEIRENPSSYKELVHPEDRARFLAKLEEARSTGKFDEEFRIVRADGVSRWIWSKGTAAGRVGEVPARLVGIAQDITERKQAEMDIAKHLAAAEAARAEAEALRLSTLTLTKNLSMDTVLDTLLASLLDVVPYETASVILTENDCLYVARTSAKTVQMLEGQRNTFLERVRLARKSAFVPDTAKDEDWEDMGVLQGVRSWICVPLIASTERPSSERVLGLLSIGHSHPGALTTEHFRVAQSLAISAAVAIQNARLYERAEIYAAELEALIGKQGQWQARKAKGDA
jgi:PAS domain S-box-containing protein